MPYIQNISKERILSGEHISPELFNCDLIQITGVASFAPKAKEHEKFKRIIHLDFEDTDNVEYGAMNEEQAKAIVKFLRESKEINHSVVVHCFAGLRRSGAVVEYAVGKMGFEAFPGVREPNKFVLDELNKV